MTSVTMGSSVSRNHLHWRGLHVKMVGQACERPACGARTFDSAPHQWVQYDQGDVPSCMHARSAVNLTDYVCSISAVRVMSWRYRLTRRTHHCLGRYNIDCRIVSRGPLSRSFASSGTWCSDIAGNNHDGTGGRCIGFSRVRLVQFIHEVGHYGEPLPLDGEGLQRRMRTRRAQAILPRLPTVQHCDKHLLQAGASPQNCLQYSRTSPIFDGGIQQL